MFMRRVEELARIVESIVYTPTYLLLGVDLRGRIVYQTMEGGFNSIWYLDATSGTRRRLTETMIHWPGLVSRNRRRVSFTRDVSGGKELQVIGYIDLEADKEVVFEHMEPVRVLGFADDGEKIAFAGASQKDVALYVVRKDSVEKLVNLNTYAIVTDVSKDFIVGFGNLRRNPRSKELFIHNISTGETEIITPREGSVNENPIILPNGDIIFESNALSGDSKELLVYDFAGRRFKKLVLPYRDYENYKPVENIFYKEFEGKLVVVGKRDGRSKLFIDGKLVETPVGSVLNAFIADGKIYYTFTSLAKPTSIMVYDGNVNREVLSAELPEDIKRSFGEVLFTRVRAPDGVEVPTFIIKSRRNSGINAFVVFIHGGPWWEVADEWNVRIAPLVASGFNVVAPNFRGSTGYGESFRQMDIGDPGGGDLLDVESVTRWALESNLGRRAFIWGYSYGGYMTLWAMASKPDLYECGVAGAPVADWEEMYELSDAVFREFIDILFAGKRELWKQRSPSTYAHNVMKPLCIIQPQNDSRTPLKPVLKFVERLAEHGKTFELHVIPGSGHLITEPAKLAQLLTYMLLFFEKCSHGSI